MIRRIACIAASASFAVAAPVAAVEKNEVEIVNIRIGQGDATLIRGPADAQGKRVTVLFDAGDDKDYDGSRIIAAVLSKRNIKHIDYVVISHYDADHIGGLITERGRHGTSFLFGYNGVPGAAGDDDRDGRVDWEGQPDQDPDPQELGLGDDISVGSFIDRGDENNKNTIQYQRYVKIAAARGARISLDTQAKLDSFAIDLGSGARMTPYASAGRVRGATAKVPKVDTENEQSVSMLVTYGKFDFLVSGHLIARPAGAPAPPHR